MSAKSIFTDTSELHECKILSEIYCISATSFPLNRIETGNLLITKR